jgi:hypothetical protein
MIEILKTRPKETRSSLRSAKFVVAAMVLLLTSGFVPLAMAAPGNVAPGLATAVVVTLIPPKLPADGGSYAAVVVSLADSAGSPSASAQDVEVFLTSSQTNIATVPNSVTISAGQEYAIANVTTTSTPGATTITAHAEGLTSTELSSLLTTVTPSGFPSKLMVFTSPSEYRPGGSSGVVRIEVVDESGLPSKALADIPVQLVSSNSSIVGLNQSSLTIPQGSIMVTGALRTSESGRAVISATSTGYGSGTGLVTVDQPNLCLGACGPYQISLKLVPGVLPSDGQTYNVLEVGLETQGGSPAVSSTDTIVQLTSDQSDVASVPALATISAGQTSSLVAITTSALASTANITAAATGLLPSTIAVHTIIPAPSKLQAYVAPPSSAYSTDGNFPILVVQLQDSSGNPARARADTTIVVTSSNGSLLAGSVSLTIPTGGDYAMTFLHTAGIGSSVLTVSSQGLSSSQANLESIQGPLAVALTPSSTFIFANQTVVFTFKLSFVGTPMQNVNVTWQSTGGATFQPNTGTTGADGTVSAVFYPPGPGTYNITASASTPVTGAIVKNYGPLTVVQVPQKPPPSLVQQLIGYWYYIVAAVAVVVIAVAYLFRMRRKKQRAEIEAGFEVV